MAVLALVFWSFTALAGLYLLAIWLIEYDPGFQHATPSRLPALVVTGHVLFAVVGLLSWVTYLITANETYCWTSAGALAAIATLGFTMVLRWIGVYRTWQQASSPAGPTPYAYGAYTLTAWGRMRGWPVRTPDSATDEARPWELAVPPERHFPVHVVIAHGILAVTTVVLVVLTLVRQVAGLRTCPAHPWHDNARMLRLTRAGALGLSGHRLIEVGRCPPRILPIRKTHVADLVSCGSAGNCAAGGGCTHRGVQGFVAVEKNGRWAGAIEVPGLAALSKRGAEVDTVSCGGAGNCAAGGHYADQHGHELGFVAAERHSRWGKAIEVPGLRALNTSGLAGVNSVSCGSAGNCAAGGNYNRRGLQGFVAVEKNGRWGTAIQGPGLAALNKGGNALVQSVSCAPAGACAAGGYYADAPDDFQGFVVSQTG